MPKKIPLSEAQIAELKEIIEIQEGSARELARCQAILLYERGLEAEFIKDIAGLRRSAIFKWRARYQKLGAVGLHEKKSKPKALLTKSQIASVVKNLKTTTPKDFGYKTEFWSTDILGKVIELHYNVKYTSKKKLYLIFEQAEFTYHKPGQQYRNRNQEKIDQWVKENTPIIKRHLEDPDTVVLTGDEMVLSTQTTSQKVWLPVNTFPKVDVSNVRASRSVYGFLNVQTGVEHAFKTEWQNSKVTCQVLEQLRALYPDKKIVIVWDNAPWHRSALIKQWLSARTDTRPFHLIAFPPYAPELNPQEHVWKAGRAAVTHNKFIANIDTATSEFVAHLKRTLYQYDFLDLIHA